MLAHEPKLVLTRAMMEGYAGSRIWENPLERAIVLGAEW
jgi:hypothetical protein